MSNSVTVDSTENPVYSVCVFQAQTNRAEIRRIFAVDLNAGTNEVCVEKLPNSLDKDSIRIEGLGSATIVDVIYVPPASATPTSTPATRALTAAERVVADLASERTILTDQGRFLEDYSKTLNAEKTDGSALDGFLELYVAEKRKIYDELAVIANKMAEAEAKVNELKKAMYQDAQGMKRGTKITVVVDAEKEGKAEFSLWYVVSGASWTPLYDLRAAISTDTKAASTVTVQYRASISQSTGEDWTDVDLSLSTASPLVSSDIPVLQPYRIGPPRNVYYNNRDSLAVSGYRGGGAMMMSRSKGIVAPQARVQDGATSTTFIIDGKSNIPSDSADSQQTHKVAIAVIDLTAKLEWIVVPKEQASAFLRCQVKNTSPYLLLEGQSSVFMDNNFVCKSTIPNVSPQESFSTSLGVDPSLKVTYHPQQKRAKNNAGGLLATKTDVQTFTQRITIKNTRTGPGGVNPVIVKDQIPVSQDSAFKVNLHEPKELGLAKERKELVVAQGVKVRWAFKGGEEAESSGEPAPPSTIGRSGTIKSMNALSSGGGSFGGVEEEGVLEWVCDIDAGKSVDLAIVWDVVAPAGQTWVTGH